MSGHMFVDSWQIVPDYCAPYAGHTWTAHSTTYEHSLGAATYKELLVEIAEFEAECGA